MYKYIYIYIVCLYIYIHTYYVHKYSAVYNMCKKLNIYIYAIDYIDWTNKQHQHNSQFVLASISQITPAFNIN